MSIESDLLSEALLQAEVQHETEVRFHSIRRWRWDIAIPCVRLAVEVDGRGYHQMEEGERNDMEKANAGIELGWRVLRYPASTMRNKKRLRLVVEQIGRIVCGVSAPDESAYVLTTHPLEKR